MVPRLPDCPEWLRKKYREAACFLCQLCRKPESEVGILEPHRIIRGHKGGMYTVCKLNHPENNIKVLCKECHKLLHSNEFI